ncbi:MAG: YidC/Oxa1 family membrane protein insertase [Ruminococcaceae bacterium]|nr:YidC/Oxa1 family membrane protein insertase [Oscillospiraceae bacterium]
MFDPILKGIGIFLGWLDKLTGNYLFALFIFALIVEILLLPFGIKQQKNSIRQAKLRPKEMAIRKKYAGRNDQKTQQAITAEIQELYTKENYSPLSGCLPLLIQLPIIMIIYSVVTTPLTYVVQMSSETITAIRTALDLPTVSEINLISEIQAKGLGAFAGIGAEAFEELSACYESLPNFKVLGMNLGHTPSVTTFNWLLLIPVLTFVVYFVSMKLTRKFSYQPNMAANDKQAGCSNKVMDISMPLMSLFFTFGVPAAVGVYWIFKSIIGTLKQFILSKVMPLPIITEEQIKEAERELKGKAPSENAARALSDGPVRSLHRIDEDDEEPYPTFVKQKSYFDKPESERNPQSEKDKKKKGKIISDAPVKEDERETSDENKE